MAAGRTGRGHRVRPRVGVVNDGVNVLIVEAELRNKSLAVHDRMRTLASGAVSKHKLPERGGQFPKLFLQAVKVNITSSSYIMPPLQDGPTVYDNGPGMSAAGASGARAHNQNRAACMPVYRTVKDPGLGRRKVHSGSILLTCRCQVRSKRPRCALVDHEKQVPPPSDTAITGARLVLWEGRTRAPGGSMPKHIRQEEGVWSREGIPRNRQTLARKNPVLNIIPEWFRFKRAPDIDGGFRR